MSGRLQQIREACDRLQAGDWTREELDIFVQTLLETLRNQRNAIAGYVAETSYRQHGSQEVDVGLTGALKFEEGLEKILASELDEGLKLVTEGNELINEAMELNRRERQRLEED